MAEGPFVVLDRPRSKLMPATVEPIAGEVPERRALFGWAGGRGLPWLPKPALYVRQRVP